jgi:hypothetical protein
MTAPRPFVVLAGLGEASGRAEPADGLLRLDPLKVASGPFIDRLKRLEAAIHAPWGQIAPAWVFYDCALAPGGVFGLALPASALPASARAALDPDAPDDALLPVAMLVAIPTARHAPRVDLVHTIGFIERAPDGGPAAWLAQAAPDLLGRLWREGAAALDFPLAIVTAPWRDPLVAQLAALGPLRVLHALNPAHDEPLTATLALPAAPEAMPADDDLRFELTTGEDFAALQADLDRGLPAFVVAHAEAPGPFGGRWWVSHAPPLPPGHPLTFGRAP